VKDWYVYQGEGNPVGPLTADLIARGIIAGKVSREAFVACQGDAQWLGVMLTPEITQALEALERSGAPVPPRPINTIPPAPPPPADEKPEDLKPLFEPATRPEPPLDIAAALAPPPPLRAHLGSVSSPVVPPGSVPPPAPLPAPAPLAAPAPFAPSAPAQEVKPLEAKKEEPKLGPVAKAIPWAIFGACVVLSLILFGVSRFVVQAEPAPADQVQGPTK
jgi:hypothetical protein